MNIVSIVNRTKTNERAEVYQLNLISPHAFRDQGIKLSKSFNGKLDELSIKLLQNHLGVLVHTAYMPPEPILQEKIKAISPYLSPLETAKWFLDRATTQKGAPLYLWQSIYEQGTFYAENEDPIEYLRLGALDYMVNPLSGVWNRNTPLYYAQAPSNAVALLDTFSQRRVLKEMTTRNVENTMDMMSFGSIGSRFTVVDTFTGQKYSRHFDIRRLLEIAGDDILDENGSLVPEQNVFDENLTMTFQGERKMFSSWDHRYFDQITSYGTYGPEYSYHDDPRQMFAINKMNSRAIRDMYEKNAVDILVAGSAFWGPMVSGAQVGVGAGDVVRIDVIESITRKEGSIDPNFADFGAPQQDIEDFQLDDQRSGNYLIQRCRHLFSNMRHEVAATVSKITKNTNPLIEI